MLRDLSYGELFLGWSAVFTLVFGTIAMFMAEDNIRSIATYVSVAVGVAAFLASWFAGTMWVVIQVAGG